MIHNPGRDWHRLPETSHGGDRHPPWHYSHRLVKDHRELVVNISTVDQVKVADHCGMVSRRKVDEFAATGLTPAPALKLRTPVIVQCPVNLECQVPQAPTLGSQGLPIGRIVAVQEESVLNLAGKID